MKSQRMTIATRMITEITDRQNQIVEMLQQNYFLIVEELTEYFQLTSQTIRHDLNALHHHDIGRHRHGCVKQHKPVFDRTKLEPITHIRG